MPPEPTPSGPPTPTPEPTPAAWHAGLDADALAHLGSKGWDKLDAPTVARTVYDSYRQAEKIIGTSADKVIRIPEATDTEGWKSVYAKLGAPPDPTGYDITGVKHTDGRDVDDGFRDFTRKVASELHLPKEAAPRLASEIVKYIDQAATERTASETAAVAASQQALRVAWGSNYDANKFLATNTAQKLGVTPDAVNALEKAIGYDRVMEMFRGIGAATGEDKFLGGGNHDNVVATLESATAEKEALKSDPDWTARFLNGGAAEKEQMRRLDTVIAAARTARGY
jgi:hypothetical protein